ncbi:MAG: hypothetical protein K0U68_08740 [Gammaproteobacteria bacterium]|nr:hypothetical protein [Gammaproteobacteria bacterium]
MKRSLIHFIVILLITSTQLIGCSSRSVIVTSPSNAKVLLDEQLLSHNVLKYGRWIGNQYNIQVSAEGFIPQNITLSPELNDRAGGIAAVCVATLIGIPFLPIVFWNGEIDSQVYVSLEQLHESH